MNETAVAIFVLVVFVVALVWLLGDTVVKLYAFRVEEERRQRETAELLRAFAASSERRRRLAVVPTTLTEGEVRDRYARSVKRAFTPRGSISAKQDPGTSPSVNVSPGPKESA